MKQIPLDIHLDKYEMMKIAGQYHFNDIDLFQLTCIYEAMKPIMKPVAYYKIGKSKEELQFIEYSSYVVCIVTLGMAVDALQNLYGDVEAVFEEYIVECISMELLKKAYEQLANIIHEEQGLWLKSYDFLGDKYPLERIEDVFSFIPQSSVFYNEALMLVPRKSVVFLAELVKRKEDVNCNICSNCGNINCPNRHLLTIDDVFHVKDADGSNNQINLSYGYQRIFGKGNNHPCFTNGKEDSNGTNK